ncbi:unnamed protein product [Ceutorhynchus assimilis]|uniref:YqaJ viral recombinase domain-containing protein n=1 Tax=Ceutorhynchus assimilis TaxID=467358 RepID=A0A9N9N032_9CUCU|nr:unnamed protein product [Ceutorhynchus assimilis]
MKIPTTKLTKAVCKNSTSEIIRKKYGKNENVIILPIFLAVTLNKTTCDNEFQQIQSTSCGIHQLNESINWTKCEICNEWRHQLCDQSAMEYKDELICEKCSNTIEDYTFAEKFLLWSMSLRHGFNLIPARIGYIKIVMTLQMTESERLNLKLKSRNQRTFYIWKTESVKRITASYFGKIWKAQNEKTKISLAKKMQSFKSLDHIAAVRYGIRNEEKAIKRYLELTGHLYTKAGIFIHKEYLFIAGSTDGLINNDLSLIIEVKCPFPGKVIEIHLEYLDQTGNLKKTHPY